MNKIPYMEDLYDDLNIKTGQLPFHIAIHGIPRATSPHHHHFMEFSFIISGQGEETINGNTHKLQPGMASLVLPQQIHQSQSMPRQPIQKYCCMFDVHILLENAANQIDWYPLLYSLGTEFPSSIQLPASDARWVEQLLEKLQEEYIKPQAAGRNSMICSILTHVLLIFLRAMNEPSHAQISKNPPALKQRFWPILQYIHVHYNSSLSLDRVAKTFNVSSPYVSQLFKQFTGKSYLEYVHHLRIDSAANLLLTTNMLITDIATETGFESLRTFSRVFQKLKNQTPGEYRDMYK